MSYEKTPPTCFKVSFSLVVSIIASNMWTINSTFLQGKEIDRDVYVKPPQEAERSSCGIKNPCICYASRVWNLTVKRVLLKAGGVKSQFDDSVLYWQKDEKLEGLI